MSPEEEKHVSQKKRRRPITEQFVAHLARRWTDKVADHRQAVEQALQNWIAEMRLPEDHIQRMQKKQKGDQQQWVQLTAKVLLSGHDVDLSTDSESSRQVKWWCGETTTTTVQCAAGNGKSFSLPGKLTYLPACRPVRSPRHVLQHTDHLSSTDQLVRDFHATISNPQLWYSHQWTQYVDNDVVPLAQAVMGEGPVAGKLFCSAACETFLRRVYQWMYHVTWLEQQFVRSAWFRQGLLKDAWVVVTDLDQNQRQHTGGGPETDHEYDCDLDISAFQFTEDGGSSKSASSRVNFWDKVEAAEASVCNRDSTSICSRCDTPHMRKLFSRKSTHIDNARIYDGVEALCIMCVLFIEFTRSAWEASHQYWHQQPSLASRWGSLLQGEERLLAYWGHLKSQPGGTVRLPDHWQALPRPVDLPNAHVSLIYQEATGYRNGRQSVWCQVRGSLCRNGMCIDEPAVFVYFGDDCRVMSEHINDDEYEKQQLKSMVQSRQPCSRLTACACCMEEMDLHLRRQQMKELTATLLPWLPRDVVSVIDMYMTSPYRVMTP